MQAYENVYVQWSFNIFTLDSRKFGFGERQANEINWRSNRCLRIYDYSYKNEIRTSRFTINFEIRFDNPNLWMYRIEDIHERGSHKGNNGVSFCILWSIPHLKKRVISMFGMFYSFMYAIKFYNNHKGHSFIFLFCWCD